MRSGCDLAGNPVGGTACSQTGILVEAREGWEELMMVEAREGWGEAVLGWG